MGIDSSIALGVKPVQISNPMNALAQMMQIKDAQQASQLNAMKMDEAQRGIADQNALRGVYAQFGTDSAANTNALYKAGLGKEAGAYAKSAQDMAKDKVATEKDQLANVMQKINMAGQLYGSVTDQPSHDRALATAKANGMDVSNVPLQYDPAFIKSKIDEGTDMKTRLEQLWKQKAYDMPDANAVLSAKTSTSNNEATNATSRENNAASVGATMRGQNMTDARSRDTNAATMTKPFEVTGPDGTPVLVRQDKQGNISRVEGFGPKAGNGKALTEGQSKAVLFGSRMEAANKIMAELAAKGADTASLGANTGFGVGSIINAAGSDDQQGLHQAQRDFVNAVLRRESGASISPAEFESAQKQYFPQIGEGAAVKKQKEQARAIAIRGMQAEIPAASKGLVSEVINGPSTAGSFSDAAKEKRYQEWKAGQNK